MQIQVSTDHNIKGDETFVRHIEAEVLAVLGGLSDQITRVEIHLSDENGPKAGHSVMRCLIEVRSAGRQPVAASDTGDTVEKAFDGAAEKMQRMLESTLGRLHDHRAGDSDRVRGSH